jgi:hypothetical protein
MPKMLNLSGSSEETFNTKGAGSFTFSAIRPEDLEETEYTLAAIVVDASGSVSPFENDLVDAIKSAVEACNESPRSNNLLVRVTEFKNYDVDEIHGFRPLGDIDVNGYSLNLGATTPLFDATSDAVGAVVDYGEKLVAQDFDVNAIVFVITDGMDNTSKLTTAYIKQQLSDCITNERIESITTVLVGVNASDCTDYLNDFKVDANLTQFIDIGDASPGKLAKLAVFVSKSISSTSQALGTGNSVPVGSLTI